MNQTTRGLNNYQKRLVHELVRAEFAKLTSTGRMSFIQVTAYDAQQADAMRQSRTKRLEEQLSRQIGLRWLVEAMVGGDLSGIDARNFARTTTGEPMFVNLEVIKSRLTALKEELKGRRTVLVGHNLFTDLLYFYQCFLGQLPNRVEDFQKTIHNLFPMVIDTKYLATHNCGSISLKSSLEEIEEGLRSLSIPFIGESPKTVSISYINGHVETHIDHPKYSTLFVPHEAGYDSFLTAKVLIRLSAQLEIAGTYMNEQASPNSSDKDDYETAPEDAAPPAQASSRGKKPKRKTKKPMERSAFSHATKFDVLGDLPSDEETIFEQPSVAPRGRFGRAKPVVKGPPQPEPLPKRNDMMPPFHSEFWRVYGNKLRVFGTVEGVCDLTKS